MAILMLLISSANLLLFGVMPAAAGLTLGPETNLTPNGLKRASHIEPDIYDGRIVWADNRHGQYDIYMKDLATGDETRVTSNATDQLNPSIFGDRVAWVDIRNGGEDIYIKDLSTGQESAEISNASNQLRPVLHNDWLGWHEFSPGSYWGATEAYVKNLNTGAVQKMAGMPQNESIDIWGDRAVWNNRSLGLWSQDLVTGADSSVTSISEALSYTTPAIYADDVVWNQPGSSSGIYEKDLVTGTQQVVSAGTQQYKPDIYGDVVVWEDDSGEVSRVFYRNTLTGQEGSIDSSSTAAQRSPRVWGDIVVWEDHRNGTPDIYMKNLTTGAISQVNSDEALMPADQFSGDIDGSKVVWEDNRLDAPGLYVRNLSESTETRFKDTGIPPNGTQQWNPRISGSKVVWTDPVNAPGVYLSDLSLSTETTISVGTRQIHPAISGSDVVWQNGFGRNDPAVYHTDLDSGLPPGIVADIGGSQLQPDVSNGKVVWEQRGLNSFWESQVYIKDLAGGSASILGPPGNYWWEHEPAIDGDNAVWTRNGFLYHKNLTSGAVQLLVDSNANNSSVWARQPAISGDLVAWTQGFGDEADIYLFNLSTGIKISVTTATGRQDEPRVSGSRVIWTDYRNGNADIYMRDILPNSEPTISGYVSTISQWSGNQMLAGAVVVALPVDGAGNPDSSRSQLNTVTDEAGYYLFDNPAAGDYKLRFDGPPAADYSTMFYDQKQSTATASIITVGPGIALSGIDAQLFLSSSISGRVTDASGTPLPNIFVEVLNPYGNWVSRNLTDSDGNYIVENLADDDYRVRFVDYNNHWTKKYATEFYDDVGSFSAAGVISVVTAQAVPGIDAALSAQTDDVWITGPAAGTTLSDTQMITAESTSAVQPDRVRFYFRHTGTGPTWLAIGSDPYGADGWSIDWDTSQLVDGDYEVATRHWVNGLNRGFSAPRGYTLQNGNPAVISDVNNAEPLYFAPNDNGFKDTVDVSYLLETAGSQDGTVTIRIYDATGTPVRTLVDAERRTAARHRESWDGRDDSGTVAPGGPYTFTIDAIAGSGDAALQQSGEIRLFQNSAVSITDPSNDSTISSVQTITATLSPMLGIPYSVRFYYREAGSAAWLPIGSDRYGNDGWSIAWDSSLLADGAYEVAARDIGTLGEFSESRTYFVNNGSSVVIKNISANPAIIVPNGNGHKDTTKISYTLDRYGSSSGTFSVDLNINDSSGTSVRALVDGVTQSEGAHSAVWDGLDGLGQLVPAGTYDYVIEADSAGVPAAPVSGPVTVFHQSMVTMAGPADGAVIGEIQDISATVDPSITPDRVRFYYREAGSGLAWKAIASDYNGADGWSLPWNTRRVVNGTYEMTAREFIVGEYADPRTYTVQNEPLDITQLTDNSFYDSDPQISGNNVVWQGTDPIDWDGEIFYYNGSTITQLTDNSDWDWDPQISGKNVVWAGSDPFEGDSEIFYYDGSTVTQLTDNSGSDGAPQISGNNVVWRGDDGLYHEIFFYDGSTVTQLSNNTYGYFDYDNMDPQISGNRVVWQGYDSIEWDYEIFYYDGSTVTQLTDNSNWDSDPQISGNNVVWQGYDGSDYEIFYYDGSTVTQLTDNTYGDYNPQISGNNVVWQGYDGSDSEIFLYDGSTVKQVTNNAYNDQNPQVSGNGVVWEGYDPISWNQVYFYDGSRIIPLANDGNSAYGSQISNGRVTWYGYPLGGRSSEIFLFEDSATVASQVSELSVIKNDSLDRIVVGENTTYTIEIMNLSDTTATSTTVIDNLPLGMSYISSNPTATVNGQEISWNLGLLAPWEETSVTVTAAGVEPGVHTNTVTVTSEEGVSEQDSERTRVVDRFTSDPPTDAWTSDNTVDISWMGGSDSSSGVAGYSFFWTPDTTAVPDTIEDTVATDFDLSTIAAGYNHTVGLKDDGTVVAVGVGNHTNVSAWTDIKAIAAGEYQTVGLKNDGTVAAVGSNWSGQTNVSAWTDIKAIAAGGDHTVGLKDNGTVVAVGSNWSGQTNVSAWTDIKAIAAGEYHTIGLKDDGTVVAVGSNSSGQTNVSAWTDIKAIAAEADHTVGLKEDGTAVAVGSNYYGQSDVSAWTDIKAIAAGGIHTVGLKEDGTAVAVGSNYNGQTDVSSWADIKAIAAASRHTVGLKDDGTVVAVGYNGDGQADVSSWSGIRQPTYKITSQALADGTWYFNHRTGDNAGNWSSTAHVGPFRIDTADPVDPSISSPSHDVGIPSTAPAITIDVSDATDTGSGVTGYSISWSEDTTQLPDRTVDMLVSEETTTSSPRDPGSWFVNFRTKDGAGNWTSTVHFGPFIILPNEAPILNSIGNKTVDAGSNLNFSISATDPNGDTLAYSAIGLPVGATFDTNSRTFSWTPSYNQAGSHQVTFKASDGDLDDAEMITITVNKENYPPSGSIKINNGVTYTKSRSVTLNLTGSDTGGSGLDKMRFKNDGGAWSSWGNYTTSKSWTLTSGNGAKRVYYQLKDKAGNVSSAYSDTIIYDSAPPTGSIKINSGATYTKSTNVTLNLTGGDTGGSGLDKTRFMNAGGSWSSWANYAGSRSWTLTTGQGTKRVYYQLKDKAGNTSVSYLDTIIYDSVAPTLKVYSPYVSTAQSKRPQFTVRWRGKDALSAVASYTLKYRVDNSKTWRTLKANTTSTSHVFKGKMGRTYYFKVQAKDRAGNTRWSAIKKTIVPYNEGANLLKRVGFNAYFKGSKSVYYLSSVRYSYKRNHTMIYKVPNAKSIGLITTKAKSRGKAKIYIDGKYVKTVDAYAKKTKPRTLIYNKTFFKKKTHYIKIVNLGTPGRARFGIDGIAVGR